VSPGSGFFVCCTQPHAHEYSQSLGRLLGRAAAVSAIYERIERMSSSTKVPRRLTRISVEIKAKDDQIRRHAAKE
jgi:ribosomal protein S12 methylthiotransferase accessory factor YcaO